MKTDRTMKQKFATRAIHAGVGPDPTTGAILTPIYQATTFVQPSVDEYLAKGFSYSRAGNPTVAALEKKITVLEGGAATTCFTTGMAATQALMLAYLESGAHCVVSDVVYGGTHRFATQILTKFNVEFSFVDGSNPDNVRDALRDNTKLIFTETPANPTLKLTDIAAISKIAHAASVPHGVDNTFLTPYFQRPLELGADFSVHSTTKYMDGHNATVGGAVVARTQEQDDKLRFQLKTNGTVMSPQVAFYTLLGIKTMPLRMEQQAANAMAVARFLEKHDRVERVAYPGLESFPQHELACRQATGFGAMVWFEVVGGTAAGKKLMDTIDLWSLAENLGSIESLVTHPVTMTHADVAPAERRRIGISDGLVRLSVGLEDAEDLIDALDRALSVD